MLSFKKKRYELDMTQGPVMKQLLTVAIPLMITGILQLLYSAADTAVVGQFAAEPETALAAVGCTLPVVSMLITTFIAITVGANVLVGQFFGKKDEQGLEACVHTSMTFSVLLGIGVAALGFFLSRPLLILMNTSEIYLDQATLYMQIYCVGVPASIIYNFGASILRAVGDTERPMRYLMISGLVNVILNWVLVKYFHLDVAGVAAATTASQIVSAFLVVRCLMRTDGAYKLSVRKMRLDKGMTGQIIKIGVPAAMQAFIMSISHVLLQKSYNELDIILQTPEDYFANPPRAAGLVAGNSAASQIDSFICLAMTAVQQTVLTFTSQNVGAKKSARLKRILLCGLIATTAFGLALSIPAYIFGEPLLSIFIDKNSAANYDSVIHFGMVRLAITGLSYFTFGIMEVLTSFLRGMGKSVSPLVITVLGVCVFRIIWIYTIFPHYQTQEGLIFCYPVSWVLTSLVQFIFAMIAFKQLRNKWALENAGEATA